MLQTNANNNNTNDDDDDDDNVSDVVLSRGTNSGRGPGQQQVLMAWMAEQTHPELLRVSWCLPESLSKSKVDLALLWLE